MEFHQLRYFIAAAEEMSISKAAIRQHVTQPALSRQIASLESELGIALFERVRQRIRLTEAGRFFLVKARQIVCDAETAAQQLQEEFGQARRTLRLGFLTPFLDDLVAPTVREFRQRHPKTRISLFELPPRAQLDRLRDRELDAAILGNVDERSRTELSIRLLSRHRMAILLPESHRLSGASSLALSKLKSEPWVSLSDAFFPGRREFLRSICQAAGFEPKITLEVDSLTMMLAEVSAGQGVALIPQHSQKLPHSGCIFVSLSSPRPTVDLLLVQRKEPLDNELATLGSLLMDHASRIDR